MANRFPLVLDTSSGNKIAEIAAGDNLDLRQTSIVDVQDITALGNINAASVSVNGQDIKPGVFTDLTDAPNSYTGNENFIIRVNSAGTGLEFFQLGGDAQPLSVTDLAISGDIQPTVAPGGDIGSTSQGFNAIFDYSITDILSMDDDTDYKHIATKLINWYEYDNSNILHPKYYDMMT